MLATRPVSKANPDPKPAPCGQRLTSALVEVLVVGQSLYPPDASLSIFDPLSELRRPMNWEVATIHSPEIRDGGD